MSRPGSNRGKGGGKGRDLLSDDDSAVWEHTARSLVPLRKSKARVHAAIGDEPPDALFAPKTPKHGSRHGADGAGAHAGSPKPQRSDSGARAKAAPELQVFDQKRARRLKSGRADIDARIDLHGMKQIEAHAALRRFLVSCHGNGLRTVLVITGKGSRSARHEDDEGWAGGHERGVLKRNVPRWLAEPELRRIVVSFTESSIRHGGEGAIYVHLRSASKLDDRA